ncbi:hypothetical protein [Shewanella sp. GutDb-MelDb]|uniref:hypothetical protein n=1 Tax=Shewanella sp. GutDb-MelDb TaxID=2058316 RepID=UPI000C7DF293|nr:hypothetical protein [Shewanella sp. GutDb-MelDb]PKG55240.1 hypothetical protein CXF82_20645 [Shewanella sp. GutDb-MelDb]
MLNLLSTSLKAGFGLTAIATALFYSMHQEWFSLGIFSDLTAQQTYNAFLYSLAATFVAFVLLLIVHVSSKNSPSRTTRATGNSVAVDSSGSHSPVTIKK